jgi:hypothetical protein
MDKHIKQCFSHGNESGSHGNFHKVILLHEEPKLGWEEARKLVPRLCKGWYELAHLTPSDRIEFTRDFWLSKLPYHPKLSDFLVHFFASLDDILIILTQQKFDDPFEAQLIYSIKKDVGFFRGHLPASDDEIIQLKKDFIEYTLPADYVAFLQIHNGFSKTTDCTGLTKSTKMKENYQQFQATLAKENSITTNRGIVVNPDTLIPFYESFGMPFLQCFWGEWYPENEMGNVYYSGTTKTISDVEGGELFSESMSFTTFLDWLMFYMEVVYKV